ncbi:MAG: choice-of-anchor Q domain-containing protein, partial [Planctomycetota bacterium]
KLDDDYRLMPGSPAIDAGDPLVELTVDAVDLAGQPRVAFCRIDAGAFENQEAFADCNDNREPDGCELADGTVDDCNNDGVLDACQRASTDLNGNRIPDDCDCQGDCNMDGGDGVVDIDDLLAVINAFGDTFSACDVEPLPTGNGIVNVDDLIAVINSFGECP